MAVPNLAAASVEEEECCRQGDLSCVDIECLVCLPISQALRAAALADAKRAEETKKSSEDSSTVPDQQQLDSTAARQSTISSTQAGTLAAAPAPVLAAAAAGGKSTLTGQQAAGSALARAAELAKAEAAYKAMEAEFKEQLKLV